MTARMQALQRSPHWLGMFILAGVVGLILLASGWMTSPPVRPVDTFTGKALGTTYNVTVVVNARPDRTAIRQAIETPLQHVDALMSTYRADSDLGRLNSTKHTDWQPVAPETARVMQLAIDIGHRTGGAYDITVGTLVNLWGFGPDRRPTLTPGAEEIAAAKACIGLGQLEVRLDPPAARKKLPGLHVDLSSIAKGFAVDQVGESLERLGIEDYCVEVGGELRTRGLNARGLPWQIAVEAPVSDERSAERIVPLSGRGMATSGDYRQYFEERGVRYSHLIDPRTGAPIRHTLASVTVVDSTCARADGWSTALMVLGPEEGYRVAVRENLAAFFIVRGAAGFEERSTPLFQLLKGNQP